MIHIEPYNPESAHEWNKFVEDSKNGTFLFNRNYMDYHSDRFEDNSLIIRRDKKIIALFPACRVENDICSHAGLTYGGLIMSQDSTVSVILSVFEGICDYYKHSFIKKIFYKPVPYIYHSKPSEEDLYALFRFNARLIARNVSTSITNYDNLHFKELRCRGIKKAIKLNLSIKESDDYIGFWRILSDNLEKRYKVKPVHSYEEILSLHKKFPENIKLYIVVDEREILGGVVCYLTKKCMHTQYIAASEKGKKSGALDYLFSHLINLSEKKSLNFDFGISTEQKGQYLNERLIYQKEGFGGSAVCYDSYMIEL